MNNGYKLALQNQLFLCAYPHAKRVVSEACVHVITYVITHRVRALTLFLEIPWRVANVSFPRRNWRFLQLSPILRREILPE